MELDEIKQRAREARLSWVEIEGLEFQIRRPTNIEAMRLVESINDKAGIENAIRIIEGGLEYVNDWNVPENRIIEGGSMDRVPFDRELLEIFIEDNIEIGDAIAGKVFKMVNEQRERASEEKKH